MSTSRMIDQLIATASGGHAAPWQQPWAAGDAPRNKATGRKYRGGNVLSLTWAQALNRYPTSEWLTYKQAQGVGAQVRKGERSHLVEFWTRLPEEEDGDGRERVVLRTFNVFNVAQVDGIDAAGANPPAGFTGDTIIHAVGEVYERNAIAHTFGGDRAYYHPGTDAVALPSSAAFTTPAAFATTALHEAVHWTGAANRLARPGITGRAAFGSPEYAAEELVAELGAFIAAMQLGVGYDPQANGAWELENHGAYLASWSNGDPDRLRQAVPAAHKAVGRLLPLTEADPA